MPSFPRLQYSVTRDYDLAFTLWTLFGFALIAGILGTFNFAADGYQTLTVMSTDFNTTQTFWYHSIIPSWLLPASATRSQCQPFTYQIGDTFRTTNRIFNWKITDVQGSLDDSGQWVAGNIHSSMPYSNSALDTCDVINIMMNADLASHTISARVEILCQAPVPLVASTVVSSSELPTRTFLTDVPWLTSTNGTYDYAPQFNVSMAVIMLGWDVLDVMLYMYELSGGAAPTMLETKFDFGAGNSYCPPALTRTGNWCPHMDNHTLPVFEVLGGDYLGFANYTLALEPGGADLSTNTFSDPAYWNPIRNFLHGAHAAARADLGTFWPNNMFQNLSFMPEAVNTTGFIPAGKGLYLEIPLGAAAIVANGTDGVLTALPMPSSDLTLIDTTYVCNRQFLKSAPALFFAITSGTLSNVLVLWGLWMLICSRWVKGGNFAMNTCKYHALEKGFLATPPSSKSFSFSNRKNRNQEDWTYTRASTDEGPLSATKSPGPFDDESAVGHHYPPPPNWMVNLPALAYNGEPSYSSMQMEDLSPNSPNNARSRSA